ncbi:hypothetical protein NDU88_009417 [Pleurodeles waltl]|uniref:Uncharacterized protein n=1 Tax=Pleurodeles waltl TaxID=8319 RepID=A0AAV7P0N2_PLEWA|nr:hypothetical protein NDU88_009417 [Pleurodeles waltl]
MKWMTSALLFLLVLGLWKEQGSSAPVDDPCPTECDAKNVCLGTQECVKMDCGGSMCQPKRATDPCPRQCDANRFCLGTHDCVSLDCGGTLCRLKPLTGSFQAP